MNKKDFIDFPAWTWRLEKLVRSSMRRGDPLAARSTIEERRKWYEAAVTPMTERLVRLGQKPSASEASFLVYGSLVDVLDDRFAYEEDAFLEVGRLI